ncbi:MAG: hypothetical protein K1X75_16515 [Leptospirales bacterium]|nr:hypothetical protein [Leptospirales bacterium]
MAEAQARQQDRSWRKRWRNWQASLPGSRRDYLLLALVAVDLVLIMLTTTLSALLPRETRLGVASLVFDIFTLTVWGLTFIGRVRHADNRVDYLKRHWYEAMGLIPLQTLRWFLLLRAAKLAIAFYKFGRAEQPVGQILTRELTFRFRDVIVDTISDAVFKRSLDRVEEVMNSLDYVPLANAAMERHRPELKQIVFDAIQQKSMVGELRRVPMLGGFADRLGEDIGDVVAEIMETRVLGDIMRDITAGILQAMRGRLRELDVERIAGRPESMEAPQSPELTELN